MHKVVLLRHGQSQWNLDNRFTGWHDVDLTDQGRTEAAAAGKVLKENGFIFDKAHTSVLKRAIRTLWIALVWGTFSELGGACCQGFQMEWATSIRLG